MNTHYPDPDVAGAILTIDLNALANNWRLLASKHDRGNCAAVVKANAYGLGIRPVAETLYQSGCREFFVAHPKEGITLRKVIRDASIHILNGFVAPSDIYINHNLIPVLNSLDQIHDWATVCMNEGNKLAADIHIDTGMSRLGLSPIEVAKLADDQSVTGPFLPRYLMTHLACADIVDHPLNSTQLERFSEAHIAVSDIGFEGTSIANSSGIFLGSDFHGDILRPGVAIYGVNPTPQLPNPMAQVIRLQAKILQVRTIDRPETVGYGAAFQASGPTRIATVAIGYADGLLRAASQGWTGYCGDIATPLAGRISMDLMGIDVSNVPERKCKPGDMIDIIGPNNPVDALATAAGTIGYEILTSLGSRYHRRYLGT